jgi:hypothetical protein
MTARLEYSQELADEICGQLSDGVSLRSVCLAEGMPRPRTVFRWLRLHEEFRKQYTIAKEESADALTEEILDIADDGANDWMKSNDKDNPGYLYNGEAVARSRLRVDTRKWIASKMKPKKYGDKIETAVTGPDGGPVEHHHTVGFIGPSESADKA